MELTSLTFLAFAVVVVVLSHCFPSPQGRGVVLALSSAAFIASLAGSALQLVPLLLFLLLCFCVVRLLGTHSSRAALGAGVGAILLAFVYLKRYSFVDALPPLPFAYVATGLSYILFRALHLAVDASQGALRQRIGPVEFFNYSCNFLSFIAGPIQRFQDFAAARKERLNLDGETAFYAFSRIVSGFINVAIISAIAHHVFGRLSARLLEGGGGLGVPAAAALLAATATVYTIYLYSNFAGYMDIVIGIGRLIGIALPENFDRPFSARNMLEFWSRWHMTLSNWFKVYVFNPLLKMLVGQFQDSVAPSALGVVAFFVTFLLMGVWHGTTSVFLVYGLALGAGASVNKLWQIGMLRLLGKKRYKTLSSNVFYAGLCTGLTAAWFALVLTCFWVDMPRLALLADVLGPLGALLAFCLLTAVMGLSLAVARYCSARLGPLASRMAAHARGFAARNLLLGGRVVLIAGVASFFHTAPEFVYRTF